jgi:hypothetical protein
MSDTQNAVYRRVPARGPFPPSINEDRPLAKETYIIRRHHAVGSTQSIVRLWYST